MKIIILLLFFSALSAQELSVSDLSKLSGQRISNSQLDKIKSNLKENKNNPEDINESIKTEIPAVKIIPPVLNKDDNRFFGYEYFQREISFFDNSPTPYDYKLGPGDEVILSIWGQQNLRETFVINKNGLIYYSNVGFINISNLTLDQAEKVLSEQLSSIYSSINDKDNPSKLMIQLGKLKSINIYFTGLISSPGVHLIHPFSDVFSAITQAGGVGQNGSLRNIKIIRNKKVLYTVDFYNFFVEGINDFSDFRLIDGDVIHIPPVKNRNEIAGEVMYEGFFELKENETISDLIGFAGGFNSSAGQSAVLDLIAPIDKRSSDDNAESSINLPIDAFEQFSLNNGDKVTILPINSVDSKVSVFGNVKNPRSFSASSTLREVLDLAGGFDDPVFRKTIDENIVVLRQDENQFYGEEFKINYKDADQFNLEPNDKIFVYEDINYRNSFTYRIEGEVNKPGTYPLKDGLTINQAIKNAGGITEIGSINSLSVSKALLRLDEEGNKIDDTELVGNIDLEFEITDNNVITVLPKTNVIRVEGNVYNPGLIAYETGRRMSLSNAIELAGGHKPHSLKSRVYVIRANGEIERVNMFGGKAKRVFPGDSVVVPADPNPDEFDITSFIADLSSTLANIAAILLIADNSN